MFFFSTLLVALLLFDGADGAACNSSGAHWATYTTTDSAGRMFIRCANSNAFFDEFEVEKLTCIDGDWFGTSCAGSAYYIGTSLPSFLCYTPQECLWYDLEVEAFYDEFFPISLISEPVAEGEIEWTSCMVPGDNLKPFRQSSAIERYVDVSSRAVLFVATATAPYFDAFSFGKFECAFNAAKKKFALRLDDGDWIPSNNISCGFKKCAPWHVYDASTGRCEPQYTENCAYIMDVNSTTIDYKLVVEPSKSARLENISASMTHMLVNQGCKASFTAGFMTVVGDRTYGFSDVFDPTKHLTCPESASGFQSIWCTCDSITPPIQDSIISPYQMSHESRFISHGPDDSKVEEIFAMGITSQMRNGQTFSLNAFGQGYLTDKIITLSYKDSETFQRVNVSKSLQFTVGDKFHIQIRTMITGWNVYFNGAFVHFAHNYEKHFESVNGIKAGNIHLRRKLPKNCERSSRPIVDSYKFSERTGDCEYIGPSSACVVLMNQAMGSWPAGNGPLTEELKQELIISRLSVRKGCWATPYNGYGLLGTACTDKDNIAGVREPGNIDHRKFPVDTVTVGSNIVFSGKLLKTGPATVNILVNSESAVSLRLSINSGYVVYGYAIEGAGGLADAGTKSNDLVSGDWFECRIRVTSAGFEVHFNGRKAFLLNTQSYVNLNEMKSLSISDMEVQEFRQQKEYVENMQELNFLLFGDYFYVNGAMSGQDMVIDVLDGDLYVVFTLSIDLVTGEVIQRLKKPSGGDLTAYSVIVSLAKETEFHVVFANKPHSLEVYINGEIIHPIIGQHPNRWAEEIYYAVSVTGATIYEMSHGPHRWD